MTQSKTEPEKIAAYILLALNVLALLYVGYISAKNDARHYSSWFIDSSKVDHLTIKEDVLLEADYNATVPVTKGTVVKPEYLYPGRIGFYFTAPGKYKREGYEKDGMGDFAPEINETEEYLLRAKPEYFVEYSELEKLYKEAEKQALSRKSEVFWKDFIAFISAAALLFAVLVFFTAVLIKKRWFVLLYVLDVVFLLNIIFLLPGFFLYH